ncbi:hypothetical protein R6G99_05395, partial [Actinotignum timonense]|nr:hypothetical protein [Actinotignum timonense]
MPGEEFNVASGRINAYDTSARVWLEFEAHPQLSGLARVRTGRSCVVVLTLPHAVLDPGIILAGHLEAGAGNSKIFS